MKKKLFFGCILFSILLIGMTSCEKDPTPPVCDFTYVADGLTVTFTSASTDASTYLWDFGDGETSTEVNPVHVYAGEGDFDVVLTATGDGGTDSKEETVNVIASLEDVKNFLTGGSGDANGKTWVLDTTNYEGDGASAVEPSMLVLIPVPADFFAWMGREKLDAYKDEFTFKYDGSYSINSQNDTIVGISLFAFFNNVTALNSNTPYGTCRITPFVQPAGATWTLHDEDFTVDAITNPSEIAIPPAHGNVTFSGKKWLSFSAGSYFGYLDFTTSSHILIKSISATEMKVALMFCMYLGAADPSGTGIPYANLPTHIFHMTFKAKP
ncbi:MAG: PKD domain-containing protein [Bacteroidales bacterium]